MIENGSARKPLKVGFKAAKLLKKALQLISVRHLFVVKLKEANVGYRRIIFFLSKKNGSRMFSKVFISDFLSESNILGLVVANAVKISIAASPEFLFIGYAVLKVGCENSRR